MLKARRKKLSIQREFDGRGRWVGRELVDEMKLSGEWGQNTGKLSKPGLSEGRNRPSTQHWPIVAGYCSPCMTVSRWVLLNVSPAPIPRMTLSCMQHVWRCHNYTKRCDHEFSLNKSLCLHIGTRGPNWKDAIALEPLYRCFQPTDPLFLKSCQEKSGKRGSVVWEKPGINHPGLFGKVGTIESI